MDSKNRRHGSQRVGNFRYLDIELEVLDKAMSALVTGGGDAPYRKPGGWCQRVSVAELQLTTSPNTTP